MSVFQSTEQFYNVLDNVFDRVVAHPENIDAFMRSNLMIRIFFTDLEAEIVVDGRQSRLEVYYGPRPGAPTLDVQMSSVLLHEIWTSKESASQAFFGGRIKTKGNLMKAIKLVDLFRECERIYPKIAEKHGLA